MYLPICSENHISKCDKCGYEYDNIMCKYLEVIVFNRIYIYKVEWNRIKAHWFK